MITISESNASVREEVYGQSLITALPSDEAGCYKQMK